MPAQIASAPDVFNAHEIARAAGVPADVVTQLIRSGTIPSTQRRFVARPSAVAAVRWLRATAGGSDVRPQPFQQRTPGRRAPGSGLAASAAAHVAACVALGLLTAGAVREVPAPAVPPQMTRMVFVASPGPGGGGGGGGLRQPAPSPRVEMQGQATLRSPVPPPRRIVADRPVPRRATPPPPFRPRPVERAAEPSRPPAVAEPMPHVVAPLATIAADSADKIGVLSDVGGQIPSHGPGDGGGAGTGAGTGIGEGDGAGVGPGSGGGTGGGPYRAGSGITPPSIIREVKPDYPQDARRRGLEGDVVVEIIVRADGSVGQVRLLQGLGGGLDERAIAAVRQWRFDPARRRGTPVDVVVEIAVEFRMR